MVEFTYNKIKPHWESELPFTITSVYNKDGGAVFENWSRSLYHYIGKDPLSIDVVYVLKAIDNGGSGEAKSILSSDYDMENPITTRTKTTQN